MIRAAVVVPAHDEQELLPGCLDALAAALAGVTAAAGTAGVEVDTAAAGGVVDVIVVADACTDATVAVARAAGAIVLQIGARRVGAARAAGVRLARELGADWIATTDADSRVPTDWWPRQLAHARAGADVVAGTVMVSQWAGWPTDLPARYEAAYAGRAAPSGQAQAGPPAPRHVHGANLAFTADAYARAGGFPGLSVSEDVAFVAAAEAAGLHVVYASDLPVVTSARRRARLSGGFATYLADLERHL